MRLYSARGRRSSAEATYRRCRAALEDLGLAGSPALEEAHAVASLPFPPVAAPVAPVGADHSREELRLVSVLCAELSVPYGGGTGPEELKELLIRRSGQPDYPGRSLRGHRDFGLGRRYGGRLRRPRVP